MYLNIRIIGPLYSQGSYGEQMNISPKMNTIIATIHHHCQSDILTSKSIRFGIRNYLSDVKRPIAYPYLTEIGVEPSEQRLAFIVALMATYNNHEPDGMSFVDACRYMKSMDVERAKFFDRTFTKAVQSQSRRELNDRINRLCKLLSIDSIKIDYLKLLYGYCSWNTKIADDWAMKYWRKD
jgi:CRISPR type I-E-associated protein CasB/Cse2